LKGTTESNSIISLKTEMQSPVFTDSSPEKASTMKKHGSNVKHKDTSSISNSPSSEINIVLSEDGQIVRNSKLKSIDEE
jgi:hypothetical protein